MLKTLLLALTISSCTSATKLYKKALAKNPYQVAKLARTDFPCRVGESDSAKIFVMQKQLDSCRKAADRLKNGRNIWRNVSIGAGCVIAGAVLL